MNKFNLILLLFSCLVLFACAEDSAPESKAEAEKTTQKHMLSEQEKMLQKAKEAEQLIKDAEEKRRQALEDQG